MSNRTFFANQSLWVSASPATGTAASGVNQLFRIQNFGVNDAYSRQNVLQLGQTDPVSREITEAPTVNSDISWIQAHLRNESGIGFNVDGVTSALQNLADGTQLDKNYYVAISAEGTDAIGDASNTRSVIGIGNATVASYQSQGAVGGFPTASVSLQGLSLNIYANLSSGIDNAAVIPSTAAPAAGTVTIPTAVSGLAGHVSALRSDGIRVTLSNNPFGVGNFCATSYNLQAQLNLTPDQCLGDRFPNKRLVTFPLPITVSLEANAKDFSNGKLASFLCDDATTNIDIQIYEPGCTGSLGALAVGYKLTNMKFAGRQFNTDTNSQFSTISINYEGEVGASVGAGKSSFLMSGKI